MPSYNLAIVGFGNVGRAFLRLMIAKETELRRKYDIRWRLTGVATRRVGWFADADGCNPFALLPLGLPATELRGFHGVLNSTTNVVLTEIEKGRTFADAVQRAQALGIAETDPTADLDGWDAAVKLTALAIVLIGANVKLEQVKRTGIRELSEEKIRAVRAAGMRYKLVCRAERKGDSVQCCVRPELLLASDALAGLEGTSSAIRFDLDMFGLSIMEHNPG